jgi:putative N6-adenine-specific DNA methylase
VTFVVKEVLNLDSYFAVTAPGLEPFTAQELHALELLPVPGTIHREEGKDAKNIGEKEKNLRELIPCAVNIEPGGVLFKGNLSTLYRANLHLRTASRILARLGNFFNATTFAELQKRLSRLPWERCLSPGQPVSIRVTCHQSKLYHSDAVARIVSAALAERLGQASPNLKANNDSNEPPQLVVVRLAEDQCTVSVDSSGTLLHKRGYRQAVAKAPLRETLAAGLLLASGWDKASSLLDPFCGSGTIPIEAALLALGIPPGIKRRFAFMDWPGYEESLWQGIAGGWQKAESEPPPILASDRDAGAIKMAQVNAERAGVSDRIEFKCQAVSSITPPPDPGWAVTNPPYGLRVSEGKNLRNLYAQFGNVLREKCTGWNLAVLCSDPALLGQMRIKLDSSLSLVNGGIRVRLGRGIVR